MKTKLAHLASLAKSGAEVAKAKALEAATHMPSKSVIADAVEATAGRLAAAIRGQGTDAGAAADAKLEVAASETRDTKSL